MDILVLAGGFGTRLKNAVPNVPKALAPVGEVPFLQMQIENWLAQGATRLIFLLHHQANLIIEFLQNIQNRMPAMCDIEWLVEPVPMDTGGAIAHAVKKLNIQGDFIVTNADTWLGGGLNVLMQAENPAVGVVHLSNVGRYGEVNFDSNNRILEFFEKRDVNKRGWINAGIYHLNARYFDSWDGQGFSLERKLFVDLVKCGSLRAVLLEVDFIDIGVPNDYYSFCRWVGAGRKISLCK